MGALPGWREAEAGEQPLVFLEREPHAQRHPLEAASARFRFARRQQGARDSPPAPGRQDRDATDI
jgi:hypothetical protein